MKIEHLKYYWLLIYLTIIFGQLMFFEFNLFILLLFMFCVARLIFINRKLVIFLVLMGLLFGGRFFSVNQLLSMRQKIPDSSDISLNIKIEPEQLMVEERYISGEGEVLTENGTVPVRFSSYEEDIVDHFNQHPLSEVESISVSGDLATIDGPMNFHVFDYQDYMAKRGIFQEFEIKSMNTRQKVLSINARITNFIYRLKEPLRNHDNLWVQLNNRVLFRMDNKSLDTTMDLMSSWGIIHLFSISGMQINWMRRKGNFILRRLGLTVEVSHWMIEGILLIYGFITYFPIGILRALLSQYLSRLTQHFDLPFSRIDQIAVIGLILLWINPSYLWSLGYQLSFGLTIAIRLFMNDYPNFYELNAFKQQSLISILCLLLVWPVFMNIHHTWFPLQLVVSILFAHFLTDILLIGFIITTVLIFLKLPGINYLFETLSVVLESITLLSSDYNLVSDLSWTTGEITLVQLLILLTCGLVYLYRINQSPVSVIAYVLTIYTALIFLPPLINPQAKITVLYVGQGDAMLIQTPHSYDTWLIDTGGKMNWNDEDNPIDLEESQRYLIPSLKALGVNRLTGVIITHPDIDHMGNLEGLAQEMPIENIYINQFTFDDSTFNSILKRITTMQPNLQVNLIPTEKRVTLIPNRLAVFTQDPSKIYQQESLSNSTSLVTDVTYYNKTILSLGDITVSDERRLLSYFESISPLILKLGHHGSDTSTSEELLDALEPKLSIISAGENNQYGHPHDEVIERLNEKALPYLSTHEFGAIQIHISRTEIKVNYVR
ncbi:ComEC/Rec2 family competence protein [Aerococcaceae bacterium DSM 111176]|nr:ComEC/Rec2 family competence protein [Aerococcaceae bacterium DSM 111176]